MAARNAAVAVAAYVAGGLMTDFSDWRAFVAALITTGITTIFGLATPLEPFVGLKAKRKVEVPVPPATEDK